MKGFLKIVIAAFCALMLASCSTIGKIEVLGYQIKEAMPESFYSIRGKVALNLANYGPKLDFTNIEGELFHGDVSLGTFIVDDLTVPAHGSNWVDAVFHINIDQNVSLLSVLNLATNFKMEEYSLSVSTKVKLSAVSKTIRINKKPISELIN